MFYSEVRISSFSAAFPPLLDDRFYRGYFPLAADDKARERRTRTGKIHHSTELAAYVTDWLQDCWSPEQIAGYPKRHGSKDFYVCHETVYRYVYSRDGHAQELYRLLLIARRTSSGHWEADLVQFKNEHGKANITSLVERNSRKYNRPAAALPPLRDRCRHPVAT